MSSIVLVNRRTVRHPRLGGEHPNAFYLPGERLRKVDLATNPGTWNVSFTFRRRRRQDTLQRLTIMRTFSVVWVPAVIIWSVCAAFASAPSQSYIGGTGGIPLDLTPTNAAGEVLLSAVTNSSGAIRITRFSPPDLDWRLRIGSQWYGITYYGQKASVGSRCTSVVVSGHSMQFSAHPYTIVSALGILLLIPIVLTWRLTKGYHRDES